MIPVTDRVFGAPEKIQSEAESMSIEIEVLNGEHSRPQAENLFRQMEPHGEKESIWAHVTWADPDLRVMVDDPDSGLVCHAGIFFRTVTWNGQMVHVGGVGQVATHPGHRRPHRLRRGRSKNVRGSASRPTDSAQRQRQASAQPGPA